MTRYGKRSIALAICLSALAGYVDAQGFLGLGFFVSFMSGNSTRLGIALAHGNCSQLAIVGGIVATFVAGVVVGTLLSHFARSRRVSVILSFVTLLLFAAALAQQRGFRAIGYGAMILAMGAENTVFQERGEVSIGLTYMTGTLVKMGQRLAGALLGGPLHGWIPYAGLWLGMVTGATVGALVGPHGMWFAALYAACLALVSLRLRPQPHQPQTTR